MRITVITPCLNKVTFIDECLDSVRSQGDAVFEHLIIDGESTDGTLEKIQNFDSEKIKLISEKDDSQSEAINKGISQARGDVICWLNADDTLEPGACQNICNLVRGKNWDVAYGAMKIVDEHGKEIALQSAVNANYTFLLRMGCYIPSSGCFFRKTFLQERKLTLREDLQYVMDWEFFLRCAQMGARFVCTKQIISAFKSYDGNMTSHVGKRRIEKRRIQREFGMHVDESFLGTLNSWVQFYLFRTAFKVVVLLTTGKLN